jgi:predicted N-acetyltransferase YhbS
MQMSSERPSFMTIRNATTEDGPACGQICYDAFAAISKAHGFPCDLPSPEAGIGLLSMMFSTAGFYAVVAERDGRIVGSNVLAEQAVIYGIGPITIDPQLQNGGVGRKLMQAVLDRVQQNGAAGVRLVQAAFHNRSLSLYASLGFEVREPLSCMQGQMHKRSIPGCVVRAANTADQAACNALARRVHGFDRGVELAHAIRQSTARVVEREGQITGYTTNLGFFGHSTAETNVDMQALLISVESFAGPGILVPSRNGELFRGVWQTACALFSR